MAHCALILPAVERPLYAFLADVLAELGVELVEDPAIQRPDLILLVAVKEDVFELLESAQRYRVPIIVLSAYDDDLMVERVRRNGVESIYPLGRPLAELRQLVASYLAGAPVGPP